MAAKRPELPPERTEEQIKRQRLYTSPPPPPAAPASSIEINGVRFTPNEVERLIIKRSDGTVIDVTPSQTTRQIGFNR